MDAEILEGLGETLGDPAAKGVGLFCISFPAAIVTRNAKDALGRNLYLQESNTQSRSNTMNSGVR